MRKSVVSRSDKSISIGLVGTLWITTLEKYIRLDQKYTAFEFRWEVAKNSPDGEKSRLRGAFLCLNQSTSKPVTVSQKRLHLSKLLHISHFWSGWLKQTSVILLLSAFSKCLTFCKPDLVFKILIERSELLNATRSFCQL